MLPALAFPTSKSETAVRCYRHLKLECCGFSCLSKFYGRRAIQCSRIMLVWWTGSLKALSVKNTAVALPRHRTKGDERTTVECIPLEGELKMCVWKHGGVQLFRLCHEEECR